MDTSVYLLHNTYNIAKCQSHSRILVFLNVYYITCTVHARATIALEEHVDKKSIGVIEIRSLDCIVKNTQNWSLFDVHIWYIHLQNYVHLLEI